MNNVKETTEYENCLDVKDVKNIPSSLTDYIDGLYDNEVPNNDKEWKKHWHGMPEFENDAAKPFKTLRLHFRNEEDYFTFAKLADLKLTLKTLSCYYPEMEKDASTLKVWIEE